VIHASAQDTRFRDHTSHASARTFSLIPRSPALLKFAKYAAFFAAFLFLLFLRRSEQFRHPQVWDEEGTILLPDCINHGALSLFHPINGYLLLATRLIVFISMHISFFDYPLISTLLTWIFTTCVCLAITFCPTWLRGRAVLGFCAILIPTDAEVIGVPLYAFWWATLLLFLVVLWQNDSRDLLLRTAFLLLGGLSTPVIVLIPPLLAIRVILLDHKRTNTFLLTVSILCAAVQILELHFSPAARTHIPTTADLLEIIPRFFGNYLLGNLWPARLLLWIAGAALFTFIASALRSPAKQLLFPFLLFLCLGCILMAALRNPLDILTPNLAGPRYFFFPDILLSWILVNLAAMHRNLFSRIFAIALLLLALVNVIPVLSRKHINLRWRDHVASATHFPEYSIPIQVDGYSEPWHLPLQQSQARAILAADLLVTPHQLSSAHPFPFTVHLIDSDQIPADKSYATPSALTAPPPPPTNFALTTPSRFTIVGPFLHTTTNRLPLHLHRGDCILYCTSTNARHQYIRIQNTLIPFSTDLPPSTKWMILDFSSDQLPSDFTAILSNPGSSPQEWFAIALKTPVP
jgi:hypothetical protein